MRNTIDYAARHGSVWPLLALLLLLGGCETAAPDRCKLGHATDLALNYRYAHVFTTAILNGTPTTLVLDTGAQNTTLTRAAAHRLSLPLELQRGDATGIGGSRAIYAFNARTFQIGTLHGRDLRLLASDMDLFKGHAAVDGLLGSDFLAAYQLDLDFAEHKAKLFKVMDGCRQPAAFLDQPLFEAQLIPSSSSYDFRPFVEVEVGGKSLKALIDSGAQSTAIFRNAARRLGLNLADLTADPHFHANGIGRQSPDSVRHVMAPITIGEITVANLPVAIIDQRSFDDADMLLGLDFLSRVHVWLSFSSHTLVMQYPPKPSPKLTE